jgi:hypothetical protein
MNYFLRGRRTSSPLQFGQTFFMAAEHASQNVHSYEQIIAMSPAGSGCRHFSHSVFICNAMVTS